MIIKKKNLEKWEENYFTIGEIKILFKLDACEYEKNFFKLKEKRGNKSDFRRYLSIKSSGGYKNEFLEFLINKKILIADSQSLINNINVSYYYVDKNKLWSMLENTKVYELFFNSFSKRYLVISKNKMEIYG